MEMHLEPCLDRIEKGLESIEKGIAEIAVVQRQSTASLQRIMEMLLQWGLREGLLSPDYTIPAGQNGSEVATTPLAPSPTTPPATSPMTPPAPFLGTVSGPVPLPVTVPTPPATCPAPTPAAAPAAALPTNQVAVLSAAALSICGMAMYAQPHLKIKEFVRRRFTMQPRTCRFSDRYNRKKFNQLSAIDPLHHRQPHMDVHALKHEYDPPPKWRARGKTNCHNPAALRTRLFQTAVPGRRIFEWSITQATENDGEGTNENTIEANALKRPGVKHARAITVATTLKRAGVKHTRDFEVVAAPNFKTHILEVADTRLRQCVIYLKSRVEIFSAGKIVHRIWDSF